MTTLSEEELRKAFVSGFVRWGSDQSDEKFELDSKGEFLNPIVKAGFLGFRAAFMPDVLNSLGIVICDNNEVGYQAFDNEWEPILYANDWTADNHGTKARPVFAIKEPK